MKKTLLATILVGVTLAATPAFATDSNTLMIFSFRPGGIQFTGSFNSSGVIHESATADSTVTYDPSLSNILVAHKVIHLSGGDINMTVRGQLNTTDFPDVSLTGTWQITGGTRAYSGVSGRGRWRFWGGHVLRCVSGKGQARGQ